MQRVALTIACAALLLAGARAASPLVMSLADLPAPQPARQFSPEQDFLKAVRDPYRERIKHPFIITKEDIDNQDAIVEDNIIVESNVLHLNKRNNELLRRVKRGWNLENVIVPGARGPNGELIDNPLRGLSKLHWADLPLKRSAPRGRGWGTRAQDIHRWPAKYYRY